MKKLLATLQEANMRNPKIIGLAVRRFASDLINDPEEMELLKESGYEVEEEKLEKLIEVLDEMSWGKDNDNNEKENVETKQLKTGKDLWNTIETAARKKENVGLEFILAGVDLGELGTIGKADYRLYNAEEEKTLSGKVEFNHYEEK